LADRVLRRVGGADSTGVAAPVVDVLAPMTSAPIRFSRRLRRTQPAITTSSRGLMWV
jgi:hypothetical protein